MEKQSKKKQPATSLELESAPTVAQVQELQEEIVRLRDRIATSKGVLAQLKSEDSSHTNADQLKNRLIELETERVELEEKYQTLAAEWRRLHAPRLD